jgi:hypothetical protein
MNSEMIDLKEYQVSQLDPYEVCNRAFEQETEAKKRLSEQKSHSSFGLRKG